MTFRVRKVKATPDHIQKLIDIDELVFGASAPRLSRTDVLKGDWWFVYNSRQIIAYAGMVPSTYGPHVGYFKRVGVLEGFRGHRLQVRLLKLCERRARQLGYTAMITDTTENPASGNSMIRAGYKLFTPDFPWAFPNSLYWRKDL